MNFWKKSVGSTVSFVSLSPTNELKELPDLGHQANLKESSESKELAELRLQVLVVVKANDACESKKKIMRLRE